MESSEFKFFLLLLFLAGIVAMATSEDAETASLTCYTCSEVASNYLCNRYAVDTPCKAEETFCQTLHVMDPNGDTASVMKLCANSLHCNLGTVGCREMDSEGRVQCISCCDERLCNKDVPTNDSTAGFYTARSMAAATVISSIKLTILSTLISGAISML